MVQEFRERHMVRVQHKYKFFRCELQRPVDLAGFCPGYPYQFQPHCAMLFCHRPEGRILCIIQQVGRVGVGNSGTGSQRFLKHSQRFSRRTRCENSNTKLLICNYLLRLIDANITYPYQYQAEDAVPECQADDNVQCHVSDVLFPEPPVGKTEDREDARNDQNQQKEPLSGGNALRFLILP